MHGALDEQRSADRSDRPTGNRVDVPCAMGVRRVLTALGICGVAIAGCTSPEVATTAAPITLSPSAYQSKLRSADIAVAAAFDRFATAGSPQDARVELAQASAAVVEAARLLDVDPPAEVLTVHRDLLAGLRQLAVDLSQRGDQAASMELCAAPSIIASVSNAPGVHSLRAVREAFSSGRGGVSYQWAESLLAPTQFPERRLANGQLLDSLRRTGNGQIRVDNGTEHDAVVKLVQDGESIISVYVGKGSNTTVDNINDGSYELFYTSGIDWDDQLKTFTRSCLFKRFEVPVRFTTVPIKGGIKYTTQAVRLQSRTGEKAPTTVPSQSFPR
ncbi:MAG: hypothetical protein QOH09_4180 [Pseudonocardiales bacterium]|jgi:hypothetical protein|nr:hypothetical protein [Pseudonocardiales bacterium]MDT7718188.1 hypothetical protein [Pseudonocardiales bacterium]